jgi:DNA-binding CsgD family transcriptional regulator
MTDLFGMVGLDAAGRGLFLGCGYDRRVTLDRPTRARWTRIGVHLATGERLRRTLEAQPSPAEAILTPSGRVEHAVGDAKASAALQSLRTRTLAVDRARGRQRRADPDAALEAWRGLVAGRWSLVDRFESDGRRYVVAHRNEPVPARLLALTLRERQVVAHRVAGHSSKVAAYALGVSPAAVSGALRSAMLKLGVRSVPQLLHRIGPRIAEASARETSAFEAITALRGTSVASRAGGT